MIKVRSQRWLLAVLMASIMLVVLLGAYVSPAAASEVFRIKVQTFQTPTNNWNNLTCVDFLRRCEERSGGRLKFLPLLDVGSVSGAGQILDAVSTGVLDAGYTASVYYGGKVPTSRIEYGLPYSWKNLYEAHQVMYKRGLIDVVRKDWARHNVRYVGYVGSTQLTWFTKKKPILSAEDFKGLKVRVTGASQYAPRKLGAAVVKVSYPELYTSLQQGVIDGCLTIQDALTTLNFDEVVKYVMHPPVLLDALCFIMNMDTWNKLPADLQAIIEDEIVRFSYANYVQSEYEEFRSIEKASQLGVEVAQMDPDLVKELQTISINEGWKWAASGSPLAADAVKIVKDYMRELGRIK